MLPIGNGIEATGDSFGTDVQLCFRGVGMELMDAGPVLAVKRQRRGILSLS